MKRSTKLLLGEIAFFFLAIVVSAICVNHSAIDVDDEDDLPVDTTEWVVECDDIPVEDIGPAANGRPLDLPQNLTSISFHDQQVYSYDQVVVVRFVNAEVATLTTDFESDAFVKTVIDGSNLIVELTDEGLRGNVNSRISVTINLPAKASRSLSDIKFNSSIKVAKLVNVSSDNLSVREAAVVRLMNCAIKSFDVSTFYTRLCSLWLEDSRIGTLNIEGWADEAFLSTDDVMIGSINWSPMCDSADDDGEFAQIPKLTIDNTALYDRLTVALADTIGQARVCFQSNSVVFTPKNSSNE